MKTSQIARWKSIRALCEGTTPERSTSELCELPVDWRRPDGPGVFFVYRRISLSQPSCSRRRLVDKADASFAVMA